MAKLYRLLTVEDGSNLTHGKFGTSERLEVIWTMQIQLDSQNYKMQCAQVGVKNVSKNYNAFMSLGDQ